MSGQLEQQSLPEDAIQELREEAAWLLKADFAPLENEKYDYCTEGEELVTHFSKVLAHFNDKLPVKGTRITALRFEKPASIPVKNGSAVDVVPVHISSDNATIGGKTLKIGEHVRLTKETEVEPAFHCLLLLAEGLEN